MTRFLNKLSIFVIMMMCVSNGLFYWNSAYASLERDYCPFGDYTSSYFDNECGSPNIEEFYSTSWCTIQWQLMDATNYIWLEWTFSLTEEYPWLILNEDWSFEWEIPDCDPWINVFNYSYCDSWGVFIQNIWWEEPTTEPTTEPITEPEPQEETETINDETTDTTTSTTDQVSHKWGWGWWRSGPVYIPSTQTTPTESIPNQNITTTSIQTILATTNTIEVKVEDIAWHEDIIEEIMVIKDTNSIDTILPTIEKISLPSFLPETGTVQDWIWWGWWGSGSPEQYCVTWVAYISFMEETPECELPWAIFDPYIWFCVSPDIIDNCPEGDTSMSIADQMCAPGICIEWYIYNEIWDYCLEIEDADICPDGDNSWDLEDQMCELWICMEGYIFDTWYQFCVLPEDIDDCPNWDTSMSIVDDMCSPGVCSIWFIYDDINDYCVDEMYVDDCPDWDTSWYIDDWIC